MKKLRTFIALLAFAAVFANTNLFAEAKEIKTRMADRLPIIVSLKAKGIIGENNKGFLEFRTDNREKASIVEAENADRKKIYEAIAKKQKVSADFVGKRRAAQIAEKAVSGEWLQDAKGKWYRKK